MSNRTFVCLSCKKLQRKAQSLESFACPHCERDCIRVHWKLHVPSPRRVRKWDKFWAQYLLELRQLEEYKRNPSIPELTLPLLSQRFIRQVR